ncbi:sigma 54-interacting transcriptional regulator [Solimonas sp. SE-A11]|uniref:sigma 54-interacting transcriptional regulator n=1 Tax=Solimonas sp. SE-A11 TaxID=3054954 RepID=UPI00259CDA6A|nr:sigma 54-interacting transcriptional regulator [Solimonas sp. SE-A11]MDM4771208.1 sigma 54-interacting transcriptional regulator [Solimonas sp. SE-A11]
MFNIKKKPSAIPTLDRIPPAFLTVFAPQDLLHRPEELDSLHACVPEGRRCEIQPASSSASAAPESEFLLSLFPNPADLDPLADLVLAQRNAGNRVTLVIAITGDRLVALGQWLDRRAAQNRLGGIRLMLEENVAGVAQRLPHRLQHTESENVIRTPTSTEVENSPMRNLFVISPETHQLVHRIRGFAQNGVGRACLLGGPGSGKTSMAYYYYLVRGQGSFVSVNLLAENTRDKAAIKSLLCGHVAGAFPGASARTGAFTQARDGVTFIDESHDISGPVMEVLMEALDNGQYLPYGATAKRQIECAVLFATNRSWTYLQNAVNLDEFTRMGAAVLQVPELSAREEDMIAIMGTVLAKLGSKCTSWKAPSGISGAAWERIRACRWHGNVRGLVRVLEAAFVDTTTGPAGQVIEAAEIERDIELWEPKTHHSHQLYAPTATA